MADQVVAQQPSFCLIYPSTHGRLVALFGRYWLQAGLLDNLKDYWTPGQNSAASNIQIGRRFSPRASQSEGYVPKAMESPE